MSAFMHGIPHIDAIIHGMMTYAGSWSVNYRRSENPADTTSATLDPTEAGRVLMRENAESMAYRYNMKDPDNPADGGTRFIEYLGYVELADSFEYDASKSHKSYTAGEILFALHSLEYQSCERPEFRDSAAHGLIRAIERVLIESMREYASANTWTISESEAA